MPLEVVISDAWRRSFPGAHIGLLQVSGVDNSRRTTPLDERKRQVEADLRQRYQGYDRAKLLEIDELKVYRSYYKRFDKTYHVLLQLESVVLAGKSLPSVSPLVDASFTAELETLILTASHDADRLEPPVAMDVTRDGQQQALLNGKVKDLRAGDMLMRDARSVVCTILYGQDQQTAITPQTTSAVYVAYVPAGIPAESVHAHLEAIQSNVLLFAPRAHIDCLRVHSAG